ncbi:uncharacterized protein K02A2.6-like [Neodiprion lecontei]|uniref:RNA-directed DNA polymerase n=1 Tax=Neodiprion lecontei TaxID=441921 RepID=A0ABM3G0U5_NEOLC|nr:uncharacterized protein K02A2.6-like [Neodiprion lecontei]
MPDGNTSNARAANGEENAPVHGIRPPKHLVFSNDMSNNWKNWIQQFEWYAIATQLNKKVKDVQAATFMVTIGPDAIQVFNNFNLTQIEQTDIEIIKNKFNNYFIPKINESFERSEKYQGNKSKKVNIAEAEEENEEEVFYINQIETKKSEDWHETIIANRVKFSAKLNTVLNERVPTILGGESCEKLELISRVNEINLNEAENKEPFEGLGHLKNFEYNIDLIDNPKFEIIPARRVPHSVREAVKAELEKMVKLNVIKPTTEPTPAISPVVIVSKNNKIRICMDPTEVNKNILRRHYPLKTMEEISARLSGSKHFTLLDFKRGFWQIKVSKRTQKYLTFSTPWGRCSCTRLPLGLLSSPEVFQQAINAIIQDLPNVECSMDDILIHVASRDELKNHTQKVVQAIKEAGLKLNKEKCIMKATKIKFSGQIVSEKVLEIDPEKVKAIKRLQKPKNKTQLQRLLGMVTYLNKFIPNMSELTDSLRNLLKTAAQQNYPQIEKQALAIEFACNKFHEYVYGKKTQGRTNQKPLQIIFKKPIQNAPSRLQRILFNVRQYSPIVSYKKGTEIPIADRLSRDCKQTNNDLEEEELEGEKLLVPESQKQKMLKNIHAGHLGIQSCLRRARQLLHWKGQYKDIEDFVESCKICQKTQKSNDKQPVVTYEIPTLPWQIVATDLFAFQGKEYILICDSYSGFIDFKLLKSQTSNEIINHLKNWFATHGIPKILESDNGPQFSSREFQEFRKTWYFQHRTSSP